MSSAARSEEHTSELQSPCNLVCRLLLEKKKPRSNPYRESHQIGCPSRQTRLLPPILASHRRHHRLRPRAPISNSSFFFNATAPTEIYTLSLHDALPIFGRTVFEDVQALLWVDGVPAEERARSARRSEEHTSELQSPCNLVCRLLLEKKNKNYPILIRILAKYNAIAD